MRWISINEKTAGLGKLGVLSMSSIASAAWFLTRREDEVEDRLNETFSKQPIRMPVRTNLLATSASVKQDLIKQSVTDTQNELQNVPSSSKQHDYDFVIVGNGNAGLSAVLTLREKCPSAKIALIDPLRPVTSVTKQLDYWPQFAVGFDPASQTVALTDDAKLHYRHAILLATGSRGAPPPASLLDDAIVDRVWELRPTTNIMVGNRPVLPPHVVRKLALTAASQGATLCVMGSGWEAVELAVAASNSGAANQMLSFGGAGPLSHVLPRYLSTAVTKRLRQQGIDVQPRSLVRYVASTTTSRLEVHTAKSYDMLDTKRSTVDALIVAPNVDGSRGTAVLPTMNTPSHLQSFVGGKPWFQSWSQLTSSSPSTVVSYDDDGRIFVNAELNAASRVYAAGSVAKYPNSITGRSHVGGEGSDDASRAGRMAALGMSRDYHERTKTLFSGTGNDTLCTPTSFAAESLPLWRSDECSYLHGEAASTTHLANAGITTLCVGQCDSEQLSTHGFWYTNTSVRADERKKSIRRRRSTKRKDALPVYGIGVVFYLDRTGRIRGVMTWGLPFTCRGSPQELNPALMERIKHILITNGGIAQWQIDQDSSLHKTWLLNESKDLATLALAQGLTRRNTTAGLERLNVPKEEMSKPLYRYTAAKPSIINGLQVIKRKDPSGDGTEDRLYVKDVDKEFESLQPPAATQDSGAMEMPRNPFHTSREEGIQLALQENELRGRPPKEEPLWLRRGSLRP